MPCTFDRYGKSALVFKAGACQSPGKNLSLLINKLQQEVRIFVVNVLDPAALKPAILFLQGLGTDLVDRRGPNHVVFLSHGILELLINFVSLLLCANQNLAHGA